MTTLLLIISLLCVLVAVSLTEGKSGKKELSSNGALLWGASGVIFVCAVIGFVTLAAK